MLGCFYHVCLSVCLSDIDQWPSVPLERPVGLKLGCMGMVCCRCEAEILGGGGGGGGDGGGDGGGGGGGGAQI